MDEERSQRVNEVAEALMLTTDSESDSDASASGGSDDNDLASILQYLIRSGQVRILGRQVDDFDDDDDDDDDVYVHVPLPGPQPKPNTSVIDESDFAVLYKAARSPTSDQRNVSQNVACMLRDRERGMFGQGRFLPADRHFVGNNYLPNTPRQMAKYGHKMFCGTYSKDGNVFLSAAQDRIIRIFDSSKPTSWNILHWITARDVGWSILDTAFSPDNRYVAYTSWSECVHLYNITGDVEKHEALQLFPDDRRFCVFSLVFSHNGDEILGGANDGCLYVCDLETKSRTLKISAHDDDVNTVAFADETSQILFSGADDGFCKVWDRRTLDECAPRPVGILAGHSDGITCIDSRGDGRYLITNSKDQSIKLWDMRRFASNDAQAEAKRAVQKQNWDYRWQHVPHRVHSEVKGEPSLMTYRGHSVLQTLIRCRFSPAFSTGQRYIYTGCAAGRVVIYDSLTGRIEKTLNGHRSTVRDVSWHPYLNELISTSWDCTHVKWYCENASLDDDIDDSDDEDWEEEESMNEPRLHRCRGQSYPNKPNAPLRRSARLAAQQQRRPRLRRSARLARL